MTGEKYGVIDIGTNSVRLMLAMATEAGEIKVREKRLISSRIGEGLTTENFKITEAAMERTIEAIADFWAVCKQTQVDHIYAYATSAVRAASNKEEFLMLCQEEFDLNVDIISGETEAKIAFLGAFGRGGTGRIIDIGGGSTELLAGVVGEMMVSGSIEMGCVRAAEMLPDNAVGYIATRKLLRNSPAVIAERKKRDIELSYSEKSGKTLISKIKKKPGMVYAVGGTATTVAALAAGLKTTYDPRIVHGRMITHGETRRILAEIGSLPLEQRRKIPILKERADVFCFGANMLLTVMDDLGVTSVVCSDRDNLEGYLCYQLDLQKDATNFTLK